MVQTWINRRYAVYCEHDIPDRYSQDEACTRALYFLSLEEFRRLKQIDIAHWKFCPGYDDAHIETVYRSFQEISEENGDYQELRFSQDQLTFMYQVLEAARRKALSEQQVSKAVEYEALSKKLVKMPKGVRLKEKRVANYYDFEDERNQVESEIRDRISHLYEDPEKFERRAIILKKLFQKLETEVDCNSYISGVIRGVTSYKKHYNEGSSEELDQIARVEQSIRDYYRDVLAMGNAYERLWEAGLVSGEKDEVTVCETDSPDIRQAKEALIRYHQEYKPINDVIVAIQKEAAVVRTRHFQEYRQQHSQDSMLYRFFVGIHLPRLKPSLDEEIDYAVGRELIPIPKNYDYEPATPQLRGVH